MANAEQASAIPISLDAFNRLEPRQKVAAMAVLAFAIAILIGAWLWTKEPPYSVLFANLSEKDGGQIVTVLQQQNVPYKYSEGGGAILVPGSMVHDVRLRLASQGLPVKTARWDEASSFFARISSGIQAFIYFATALIFLVVAFIFMNTLIISITERTAEIGTMRALGGERSFIRNLFLGETLLLNVAAAVAGMVVSLALVLVFQRTGLPLPETVSMYLVGGGPLPMTLSPGPFVVALVVVVAAGTVVVAAAGNVVVVASIARHGELLLSTAVALSEMLANAVQASGGNGFSAPFGRK